MIWKRQLAAAFGAPSAGYAGLRIGEKRWIAECRDNAAWPDETALSVGSNLEIL
jgi:hypothetical protein